MEAKPNNVSLTIMDVLGVDLCAQRILDYIPFSDLVRSARVCRQWQYLVHDYLRRTKLALTLFDVHNYKRGDKSWHQVIQIPRQLYSLPLLSRKIQEWEFPIVKVITNRYDEAYIDIILTKLPSLQHIEFREINTKRLGILIQSLNKVNTCVNLKHISFEFICDVSDKIIGDVIRDINCEKLGVDVSVSESRPPFNQKFHKEYPLYVPYVSTIPWAECYQRKAKL